MIGKQPSKRLALTMTMKLGNVSSNGKEIGSAGKGRGNLRLDYLLSHSHKDLEGATHSSYKEKVKEAAKRHQQLLLRAKSSLGVLAAGQVKQGKRKSLALGPLDSSEYRGGTLGLV